MRLSESLRRNIVETNSGSVLNKFKFKKRRNVLFFEDILTEYIKNCEKSGHGEVLMKIGQKFTVLSYILIPKLLKKLSPSMIFIILMKMWKNLGFMEYIGFSRDGNRIEITSKNEIITKKIGNNMFITGFYMGILNMLFKKEVRFNGFEKEGQFYKYMFELGDKDCLLSGKNKEQYYGLNRMPTDNSVSLKSAFGRGVFSFKKNKINYRGKPIYMVENTLFHLLGHYGPMMGSVPGISCKYFRDIDSGKGTTEKKLNLIKNLLQVMGWGIFKIVIKKNREIKFIISYPPYGTQEKEDNWDFLARVILGYLWIFDKKFRIKNIITHYKKVSISYSK